MILMFVPWGDSPAFDEPDPESTWSRVAWLPILGPSCWLLWGTIATQLRSDCARVDGSIGAQLADYSASSVVAWAHDSLARAHGIKASDAIHAPLRKSLARLCRFDLFTQADSASETHLLWRVRLSAPPLTSAQLDRSPAYVATMQRSLFGAEVSP